MSSSGITLLPGRILRADAKRRARENRVVAVAAVLFLLLAIGGAALFVHAVKTIPDFLSYAAAMT